MSENTTLNIQESFKERITGNLKDQFMDLLPDEMLKQLTDTAFDEFLNGSPDKRYRSDYNPFNDPLTLKGMIMIELRNKGSELIKQELSTQRWQQIWDCNTGTYVTEALSDIVQNNAAVFVQALFNSIISNAMSGTLNNLRNGGF